MHEGQKEISPAIVKHAELLYIEQADPDHIYLLEGDVSSYLNPTEEELKKTIEEYKNENFDLFWQINKTIQTAILRARKLREEIESNPTIDLFHAPSSTSKSSSWLQTLPKTIDELKGKIVQNVWSYIERQKKRFGTVLSVQKKERLLQGYESQLREKENQYLFQNSKGEPLPEQEKEHLFAIRVLKALASSLDAHTSFYRASEAYDLRLRLQKEFTGLGLVLKETDKGAVVSHLLSGSPAAESGKIHVGDILVSIEGTDVQNSSFDDIMKQLRGDKNTTVQLSFLSPERGDQASGPYKVTLTRKVIVLDNDRTEIYYEPFGNGIIGMITLHSFYQGPEVSSEKDVKEAIEKLENKGNLKGLILDLRDNSGGFLSQAVKVAGLFISDGVVVISKYADGKEKIYRDIDSHVTYDGPLIILTSKITASAAEIVAQALQDYGVAVIVGDEHTYGKGTIQAQTVTDNQSSSYFKVTVGKYYTVSGQTPQNQGVKADIVAPGHWNSEEVGEKYADSEEGGKIAPLYNDTLSDIPGEQRAWYLKYYIPKLQKQNNEWRKLLPTLQKNSAYRIAHNKNYQYFLKNPQAENIEGNDDEESSSAESDWHELGSKKRQSGEDDLQVAEAVNILKDMIVLHSKALLK